MLGGKVSGMAMFTTDQAVVIMTKKESNAYSLSAIRPRKKMVTQFAPLSYSTYGHTICTVYAGGETQEFLGKENACKHSRIKGKVNFKKIKNISETAILREVRRQSCSTAHT